MLNYLFLRYYDTSTIKSKQIEQMAKSKFADLVAYFQLLATNHADIGHTPEEKHFFRFELEEFMTGMSAKIRYPALILEGYDFVFIDNNSDNVHKSLNCGFMLIDKISDKGDYDAIHNLWDRLEEIGDEIIVRILHDKRQNNIDVLSYFTISDVSGSPLVDMNMIHYGFRYDFKLSWALRNDIDLSIWDDK
jgi:hypothetical protein